MITKFKIFENSTNKMIFDEYANSEKKIDFLKEYLKKGGDINIKSEFNETFIYYTTDYETIKFLIDNGIDLNSSDDNEKNVLEYYLTNVYLGDFESYKLVIDNIDDLNTQSSTENNESLLMLCVFELQYYSKEILKTNYVLMKKVLFYLLEKDTDWKIRDIKNRTFIDIINQNYESLEKGKLFKDIKESFPEKYKQYMKSRQIRKFKI